MRAIMIAQGAPAYPGVDAALRTQLVYGPVALLIPAWIAANVSPSAAALKAAVVVTGLVAVSLPLAWSGLRKTAPSAASLAPLLVMGSLLLFRQVAFRHVTDALLLLGCSLCALAVIRAGAAKGLLLWAVGLCLALGSKLHGPVYILPLVPWARSHFGTGRVLGATMLGIAMAGAPFFLPSFEFGHFVAGVQAVASHHRQPSLLWRNLGMGGVLVAPAIAALIAAGRANPRVVSTTVFLAAGVLLSALVGSKEGAGIHHMLPWAVLGPALWHLVVSSSMPGHPLPAAPVLRRVLFAWLLAVAVQGVVTQASYTRFLLKPPQSSGLQEVADYVKTQRLRAAAGFTDDTHYAAMVQRPYLAGALAVDVFDPLSIADMARAARPVGTRTLQLLSSQDIDAFVLPSAGTPFSMRSWYDQSLLFGAEVGARFLEHYYPDATFGRYTVWRAKRLRSQTLR